MAAGEKGTRVVLPSARRPDADVIVDRVVRDPTHTKPWNNATRQVLVGNPKTWWYDDLGRFCRRRGRRVIVELFGPQNAFSKLTPEEQDLVRKARRNHYNAVKAGRADP